MPHRPGKKNKIPAALTSYKPRQKEYTCSLSKSACGNGCAIYYNSSIYIDGSPSFVKGKKGKKGNLLLLFFPVHG
jgi:hypothetical protein